MHEFFKVFMTSRALGPTSPVTTCHTFSDPLPLERDVLYGRHLRDDLFNQLLTWNIIKF